MYNKFNNDLGGMVLKERKIIRGYSLFVPVIIFLFGLILTVFGGDITNANVETSIDTDFEVTVADVMALRLDNCDSTNSSVVKVNVTPSKLGAFKSNCQIATVNTNTPGYSLTVKADTSTLNYQNPTTIIPAPTIPSTTNTLVNPDILANDTWGFAVEDELDFDTNYTENNANNRYASLPTSDITVYQTDQLPLSKTRHTFYYGTKLTTNAVAGTYSSTITYTAVGAYIPPSPKSCKNAGTYPECIEFTVDVGTTGSYAIPTSGRVADMDHTYDWDVYIDGYLTTNCTNGNCIGTSSTSSDGIVLTGLSNGQHQILIIPHNGPAPGWGNAFSHYYTSVGANTAINKQKIISLDAPFTTMAFSPKVSESTTSASRMFFYMFFNCSNLTTPVILLDTYKLPDTITDFSYFFTNTHLNNTSLQSPINLSLSKEWFRSNNTISNLSNFLNSTHAGNTSLQSPIDLLPLENWFNSNNSIANISGFMLGIHHSNTSLQSPIDLLPLENWFVSNSSVVNLSGFITYAHVDNINLQSPIDLSPLTDWFKYNTTINNLTGFLSYSFSGCTDLRSPIDLTPLSGWFMEDRSMSALNSFMYETHTGNSSLDLHGQVVFPNWVKTMKDGDGALLYSTASSFYRTFYLDNAKLGDTVEVKFEDGTVLSSVGSQSSNRQTYTNRSGIIPIGSNWK